MTAAYSVALALAILIGVGLGAACDATLGFKKTDSIMLFFVFFGICMYQAYRSLW